MHPYQQKNGVPKEYADYIPGRLVGSYQQKKGCPENTLTIYPADWWAPTNKKKMECSGNTLTISPAEWWGPTNKKNGVAWEYADYILGRLVGSYQQKSGVTWEYADYITDRLVGSCHQKKGAMGIRLLHTRQIGGPQPTKSGVPWVC